MSNAGRNYRAELPKYAWDWTPLNGAFINPKIRVTDIDGMVEINGQFLILEGKSGKGLPQGQRIALERLASEPNKTVIILRGKPPRELAGWEVLGKRETYQGGWNDLRQFCYRWAEQAKRT